MGSLRVSVIAQQEQRLDHQLIRPATVVHALPYTDEHSAVDMFELFVHKVGVPVGRDPFGANLSITIVSMGASISA